MGNYGKLISPPVDLQRRNFREMCSLLGVCVKYQVPLANKQYNTQSELESSYSDPEDVWCIFTEHPDQKTTHLLGWNYERSENSPIIHLPYDLHDLQVGCLVEIPSAFDNTPGRKFRVFDISAKMIYPASVACQLAPEFETTVEKSDIVFFNSTNFNLLNGEDDNGNSLRKKL